MLPQPSLQSSFILFAYAIEHKTIIERTKHANDIFFIFLSPVDLFTDVPTLEGNLSPKTILFDNQNTCRVQALIASPGHLD